MSNIDLNEEEFKIVFLNNKNADDSESIQLYRTHRCYDDT